MPKPKSITPEKFSASVDKLIQDCEETIDECPGVIPDDYTLSKLLGVSSRTVANYREFTQDVDPDNNNPDNNKQDISDKAITDEEKRINKIYIQAIKKLTEYREHWAVTKAAGNPRSQALYMFALKQKHYGGWTDRQVAEANGDVNVKVSITGAKGGEEAFK